MLISFRIESPAVLFPKGRIALSREDRAQNAACLQAVGTNGDLVVCEILSPLLLTHGIQGRATPETLAASQVVSHPSDLPSEPETQGSTEKKATAPDSKDSPPTAKEVRCFWIEPTARVQRWLRRFTWSEKTDAPPCASGGYHNAMTALDVIETEEPIALRDSDAELVPPDDPRWPVKCEACEYAFQAADPRQLFVDRIYLRVDTGEEFPLREAPVGAMWDADWLKGKRYRGPDGRCLVVKTPAGDWVIDGPAKDNTRWTRTGEPPNLTVQGSIGMEAEGGAYRYHAILTDGVLREV